MGLCVGFGEDKQESFALFRVSEVKVLGMQLDEKRVSNLRLKPNWAARLLTCQPAFNTATFLQYSSWHP